MSSQTSPQNFLITGASGFLGSEIVRQCQQQGLAFRCTGRRSELSGVESECDYRQIDFGKDEIPASLFDNIDTVIHVAGLAHQFGKQGDDHDAFQRVNADAVAKIASAASKQRVSHFVLISSSGVYGAAREHCNEGDECAPVGSYAESKYAGEKAATDAIENTAMHLTILRMTTLYGPGDRGNVDRLMKAIDSGKFVNIGDGSNEKNLLHVSDAARATLLAANRSSTPPNAIYNVAIEPTKMSSVIRELQSHLGKKVLVTVPSGLALFGAKALSVLCLGRGPIARIHSTIEKWTRSDTFDGTKFRQVFRFTPQLSITDGIASQVKHYRTKHSNTRRPSMAKTVFDYSLGLFLLMVFAIPMTIIAVLVKVTSKGPIIYWSRRAGRAGSTFPMAKFRTMRTDTPEVATHLLNDSKSYITPLGAILRKTSLDELPQLINILGGHMSFVGPRPSLPSQDEVNQLRDVFGVSQLKPGITGWAAINGRDELHCAEKVAFDSQYLQRQSFWFDMQIIFRTAFAVFKSDGIKQADDEGGEPYIVLTEGSERTLICTTDAVAAGCFATDDRKWSDSRFVSLRPSGQIASSDIASATGNTPQIIFVSRKDSESEALMVFDMIGKELSSGQTLQHIQLPSLNSDDSVKHELLQNAEQILSNDQSGKGS
ncbi:hybrid nucleoside-diphosphate sugar epimerase/sugar transferase [Planctomycetes bacterium K23_9]|uniref:Undecaprenyl phosphate N,N'-diacetylbacillosamine 1-phosphate transferase n=1 Tax=Stieleria marina TaxID=1930275 RepID=A0A517NSK0_9BACT|nr:Undecaprenyl phosphate N,N'-diacetylbacillosamine 1-phosphate transferase [Planctomycetes bacterium K23_9]